MMSRILACLIISMVGLAGAASDDETELRTAVRAMMAAYLSQDVEGFAQYVTPTLEGYDDDPRFGVKGFNAAQLRHAFASGLTTELELRLLHVRVFGKHASVALEMEGSLTETTGKTHPGPWRLGQMWRKANGNWQLTHYHGFPLLPRMVDPKEALDEATAALERFRDVKVAQAEGYVHYDGHDTFMMGEHWSNRDIIESAICDRSQPSHLQYLMINGRRTLIGTGYICLPASDDTAPVPLFGDGIVWHTHGPALCRFPNGNIQDFRSLADALPNALTDATWYQVCQKRNGHPILSDVSMLHTWNWIPHPKGPFVHENPAIPFLRVGLEVPTRMFLDSEDGRAVLETLRLAHGDVHWRYRRAFAVVNATAEQRRRTSALIFRARRKGEEALYAMRAAEKRGDRSGYLQSARSGARVMVNLHRDIAALYSPEQRDVLQAYLESLHMHDHKPKQAHAQH